MLKIAVIVHWAARRLELFGDGAHRKHGVNWKWNQMLARPIKDAQTKRLRRRNTLLNRLSNLRCCSKGSRIVPENTPAPHARNINPALEAKTQTRRNKLSRPQHDVPTDDGALQNRHKH